RWCGRAGDDVLTGDTGWPRAHGSDFLDGGAGRDTASWEGRTKGVRVDLASGVGGQRGERDVLKRIEDLSGGQGPDVLRGDARANGLMGGPGADTLVGRAGADTLDGSLYLIQTQ